MAVNKTSPGVLRCRCMLWEPNPIMQRPAQKQTFVYNSETMRHFSQEVTNKLSFMPMSPHGPTMGEIYYYRDTFVEVEGSIPTGAEINGNDVTKIRNWKSKPLFDSNGVPTESWVDHQTFVAMEDLFGTKPTFDGACDDCSKNESGQTVKSASPIWTVQEKEFPGGLGGDEFTQVDSDAGLTQSLNAFLSSPIANVSSFMKEYAKRRIATRYLPVQHRTSEEYRGNVENPSITTEDIQSLPVHWGVEKKTPLFRGEDFFVEFHKNAHASDVVATTFPFRSDYDWLDNLTSPDGDVPVNGGVVNVDQDGEIEQETIDRYNLRTQPYYLVEIGAGRDSDDHYAILFAYNAKPVFIHVGKFPILLPQGEGEQPKLKYLRNRTVSRKLSTYKISSQTLMDRDSMRMTVQNVMGSIIITFDGFESEPWIISRSDYEIDDALLEDESEDDDEDDPITENYAEMAVPMMVPPTPIRIFGGHLSSSFTFGPLHYEDRVEFTIPQAICVKGPLEERDLNLFLRESANNIAGQPVYFQDAEVYYEHVKGQSKVSPKITTLDQQSITKIKGEGKNTIPVEESFQNAEGEALSFIQIQKITNLLGARSYTREFGGNEVDEGNSGGQNQSGNLAGLQDLIWVKYFNAKYAMGSGDYTLPGWKLFNVISPAATGWTMYVPPGRGERMLRPIDVSHLVENISIKGSYTNNSKVERSGSITFRLNFGQDRKDSGISVTGDSSDADIDHARYVASLNGQNFWLRIYAWWEGGYMSGDGYSESSPFSTSNPTVLFTGFANGGDIEIETVSRTMTCQLFDYSKILEDSQFLNSPFFDGMRDFNAVNEVINMWGFDSGDENGDPEDDYDNFPPASDIKRLANSTTANVVGYSVNGEKVYNREFALPQSYDMLQSPTFKFEDGSTGDAAIQKFSNISGKVSYFDRYGIFQYAMRPDILWFDLHESDRRPRWRFYASPRLIPDDACNRFDMLSIGSYGWRRAQGDVVNEIQILSATPQGEILISGGVNHAGKHDPTRPGYIGYTKRLMQMDGIFGSEEAVRNIAKYYEGFYIPPVLINWKSIGFAAIQPMDIVTFTGLDIDEFFPGGYFDQNYNTATLILTSVNMDINPKENSWENSYEGEWIFVDQRLLNRGSGG